jgi:hypothetical protein
VKKARRHPLWSRIWSSSRADRRGLATIAQASTRLAASKMAARLMQFSLTIIMRLPAQGCELIGDFAHMRVELAVTPGAEIVDQCEMVGSFGQRVAAYFMNPPRQRYGNLIDVDRLQHLRHCRFWVSALLQTHGVNADRTLTP